MRNIYFVLTAVFYATVIFADEGAKDLNWYGDFRYRHEYVKQESPPTGALSSSYHQHRIRARLGLSPVINEQTSTEFRLTTAPGRTGTNQTLGASSNSFSNYTITLDRAGFKWKPNDFYSLTGGRLGNSFFEPGESDLIWDTDLNFDGMMIALRHTIRSFHIFFNSSYYWVDKSLSSATQDVVMKSVQVGVSQQFNEDMNLSAGVAVHHFSDIQGHAQISTPTAPAGNSTTGSTATGKKYATPFNLINPGAEIRTKLVGISLAIYADYVVNSNAVVEKTGYLTGAKLGKLKTPGDFSVAYDYRLLKRDATLASFTDADSFGGGTNGRSHRLSVSYQIAQNWAGSLTGFLGQAGISSGETSVKRNKVHLDLVFKF